jgi:hypothetical protein
MLPTPHITRKFETATALAGVPQGSRGVTLFRLVESVRRAGVPLVDARPYFFSHISIPIVLV